MFVSTKIYYRFTLILQELSQVTFGVSSVTTAREDAGEPRMAAAPLIKEAVFEKDSLRVTATALMSLTENAPTELLAGANAAREHTKRRATMIDEVLLAESRE